MKQVFDFRTYRDYLKNALPTDGAARGTRNKLAEALGVQKGFVSQVLSERSHFSFEHGMTIAKFLGLDQQEEEYFLLLLHKDRAGSKDLEKFYQRKLDEIQERRKQIKEVIRSHTTLTEHEQMKYYSSWIYTAVHMCLMIPELRTKSAIADYLGLNQKSVTSALEFLTSTGLAEQHAEKFKAGPSRIHLPANSPLINQHHGNWRMRAMDSLNTPDESDLHYSLVMSISDEAAEKIRALLLTLVRDIEPVMKAADDQAVFTLNLDLFKLGK